MGHFNYGPNNRLFVRVSKPHEPIRLRPTNMTPELKNRVEATIDYIRKIDDVILNNNPWRRLIVDVELLVEMEEFFKRESSFMVGDYRPNKHIDDINRKLNAIDKQLAESLRDRMAKLQQWTPVACDKNVEKQRIERIVRELLSRGCLSKSEVVDALENGMRSNNR